MNPSSSLKTKSITNYCDDVSNLVRFGFRFLVWVWGFVFRFLVRVGLVHIGPVNRICPPLDVTEPNCKRTKDDALEETAVHDVFVSFSEDTANGFSAHLRGALRRHGFTRFDHAMLPSGHDVCSELLKAIKKSGIYVVVFSVNYASSERCLDELVNIMRCFHKSEQRKVLPVFFNVEPSDVRKQEGSYEEAFAAHVNVFDCERVQKWRQALKDAGELSGYDLQNGDEAEFVKKIVEELENMQNPQELYVADHCLVGIRSRVGELISYLRLDLEDVLIVAVLGISGIGKTTIAKATYNRIASKFEASCFLEDIQNHYGSWSGKVDLQKVLISSLSQHDKDPILRHHNDGVSKIRKLIGRRKLLLVLDNVDKFEQLQTLLIDRKYFHQGSRIIVTTRDISSLGNLPYTSYNTRLLDDKESVELSTQLTFEQDEVIDEEVVKEIGHCAAGLPLVLEILSLHFRRLGRKQWPSELKKLKRIPHDDVQKKLKMSYDSLTNSQKKLFLDIACFFENHERRHVIVNVLEDEELGFFPEVELQRLAEKGLVRHMECSMHDVIRKMGKEIARQENEDDPGQRTRLSDERDVLHVLRECSGTESVESIRLDSVESIESITISSQEWREEKVTIQVEAIRKMSNLRLIRLVDYSSNSSWASSNDDTPPLSFKKLRFLVWWRFPFKSLNIDMPNAVVVRLWDSKLEILWEGRKSLKKLRFLSVWDSSSLTRAPNFFGLENLEELDFSNCPNLEELDNSLGCLDKLVKLYLDNCKRLWRFPLEVIGKLRSLQVLNLTGCRNIGLERDDVIDRFLYSLKECRITRLALSGCNILKISDDVGSLTWLEVLDLSGNEFPSLPDGLGKLHQLTSMDLSDCGSMHSIAKVPPNIRSFKACNCKSLTNLPSNMSELKSLEYLDLKRCLKLGSGDPECLLKLIGLTNLHSLEMSNCNVSQVPIEIRNLVSLSKLDLSGNTFSSLPDSFSNLWRVNELMINDCYRLRSLPLLPSKMVRIQATWCRSLDVMSFASKQMVDISDCPESLCSSGRYEYEFSKNVLQLYKKSSFIFRLSIRFSNNKDHEVPNWCMYRSRRHSLSFMAPPLLDKKIYGMIFCAHVKPLVYFNFNPTIHNTTKKTIHRLEYTLQPQDDGDSLFVKFYRLDDTTIVVEACDTVIVEFPQEDCVLKFNELGLSLIYDDEV